MRKYLKNKNEYIEDGKHFVEQIRKCTVWKKRGDIFLLECGIIQRGKRIYTYDNPGYLKYDVKKYDAKKRWLSEQAKKTVREAIDEFEHTVKDIKEGDYIIIPVKELAMTVYFKRKDEGGFHFMLEYSDEYSDKEDDHQLVTQVFDVRSVEDMIREILFCLDTTEKNDLESVLRNPSRETIHQNPVYQAAVRTGDELLQHQIKQYYRIADDKECAWLSDYFGVRILPSLSEEFDRDFVVDKDSIDGVLLANSGYWITHRPYFAMKGFTHTKYTLNPHTKIGRDAARCDETAISFQEYLELFEKNTSEEGC